MNRRATRSGRRDNGGRPPGASGRASQPDAGRAEPIRVLYIAGIGRSGSTLLNRTLGTTPGFFAGGELLHFFGRGVDKNELCACGTPFRDCDVWGEVIREMGPAASPESAAALDPFRHAITEGKHSMTILLSPWRPPALGRRVEEYKRTVVDVYRAVQRVTGCRVVVDSSKNLSYARILQSIPELRLFIVHLVRDSRGVAFSMSKTIRRPGVPWTEEFLKRRGPAAGAAIWTLANVAAELQRPRVDGYTRVHYSDFVASPADTLRRILRMTGEEEDDGRLAHIEGRTVRLGVQHILSGNPIRARTGEIPLREDVEWRREMEPASRRLVTALTLPFLARYGYLRPERRKTFPSPAPEEVGAADAPISAADAPAAAAVRRGVPVAAPTDGAG